MKKRINTIKEFMLKQELDTLILTTNSMQDENPNIKYLTGFQGVGLFILRKEPMLIVSSVEYQKAKNTRIKTILLKKEKREKIITQALGNCKRIGIDKSTITLREFEELKKITKKNKAKFFDVGRNFLKIRSVKNTDEIKHIQKACAVCDEIFNLIIKNFKFKTEEELASFIEIEIKKRKLKTSFNPIVSSGKNGADIHHNPKGKITKGFLILDFGCKVNGYCSDMTRTIYVGEPSKNEIQMYNDLLSIQNTALALAKVGEKCSKIDKFARDMLGERFSHGLGHGVGLEIHELPNLTSNSLDILEENNIITIEPGIYLQGKYGIRIEDSVLITKQGPVRLTKSPKELIVVKLK